MQENRESRQKDQAREDQGRASKAEGSEETVEKALENEEAKKENRAPDSGRR